MIVGLHDSASGQSLLTNEQLSAVDRAFSVMDAAGSFGIVTGAFLPKSGKATGSSKAEIENNFYRDSDSITKAFDYGKTIIFDPSKLSFSQATVSYQKVGKSYNYDSMVESMKQNGWNGEPVDIVIMPNGTATSMDNTRILAAREAGIDVKAKVRDFNSSLTKDEKNRFTVDNVVPNTWGEAIKLRVNKQSSQEGTPINWSIQFPYGSIYDPKVIKSK